MRHRECVTPPVPPPFFAADRLSLDDRREAVSSGLVPPCIMCLTLPQSEADYFCSRVCRDDSMNKPVEYDEEESSA